MEQLTKNFWAYEFNCKDGTEPPKIYHNNRQLLADNLQVLRDYIGEPIHINSAYRHPLYNDKIGGAKRSQHKFCKAADITCKSKTPRQVHAAILKLIKLGKMRDGGLGLYRGFVHYDVRTQAGARW